MGVKLSLFTLREEHRLSVFKNIFVEKDFGV
jgi:hypothetical protein